MSKRLGLVEEIKYVNNDLPNFRKVNHNFLIQDVLPLFPETISKPTVFEIGTDCAAIG